MAEDTLFYWGMLVTSFLFFAGLLAARQQFEDYVDHDEHSAGPPLDTRAQESSHPRDTT